MISVALAFLAAAAAQAAPVKPAPAKTVLFLKCAAEGAIGPAHQLDIVFFDPKPSWAKGFNFFDPDKILPPSVVPDVVNNWPGILQIELNSTTGGNSALIQVARDPDAIGMAKLNIAVIDFAGKPQPSYRGQCKLTEGIAAETEFRGLMKQ
jgi:hypothetical protein